MKPIVAEGLPLKRFAFMLHLREGAAEAYEEAHREIWPEMTVRQRLPHAAQRVAP